MNQSQGYGAPSNNYQNYDQGFNQSNQSRYDYAASSNLEQGANYGQSQNQGRYAGEGQSYGQPAQGQYSGQGQSYPMQTMNATSGKNSKPFPANPSYILTECSAMDRQIDEFDQRLRKMEVLQKTATSDPSQSQAEGSPGHSLTLANTQLMGEYRSLVEKIRWIKSDKRHLQPTYFSTVDRIERRLKEAIEEYKRYDQRARNNVRTTMARQYQTIYQNATDQEALEAVDDPASTQLFSQALMQGNRRGQSQSALQAVQSRHEAIQKIERQLIELSQLFDDLNATVQIQEPVVSQINEQSEVVHTNVNQANTQLDGAIKKARSANRKKWICLGIGISIILIIIIVVVVAVEVLKNRP